MSKAIFDMGFVIADVRPPLPTASAEDQRLVFELLKRHLCLEVSAIAMIDLDDYIADSHHTCPVLARHSRGHFRGRCVSCISQPLAQAEVAVFEAEDCHVLR
jgi:hypothetical protein